MFFSYLVATLLFLQLLYVMLVAKSNLLSIIVPVQARCHSCRPTNSVEALENDRLIMCDCFCNACIILLARVHDVCVNMEQCQVMLVQAILFELTTCVWLHHKALAV